MNPLKQGLKPMSFLNLGLVTLIVKEVNPLKQGLKHPKVPVIITQHEDC